MRYNQTKSSQSGWLACLCVLAAVAAQTGCITKDANNRITDSQSWRPPIKAAAGLTGDAPPEGRPLRAADELQVTLQSGSDVSPKPFNVIVDDDGCIPLPIIGVFRVVDLTAIEAGRAIGKAYVDGGIFLEMTANVLNVTQRAATAEMYSVTGEVAKRGSFNLVEGLTLRRAIIAAGDVSLYAGDRVVITRNGVITTYSLKKIIRGSIPDPVIKNGDIIEVKPPRGFFMDMLF